MSSSAHRPLDHPTPPPPSAPALRPGALARLAALALAGIGLATAARAAASTDPPSIVPRPCEAEEFAGARCGALRVPLDPARPGGAQTTLSLVVRPAGQPSERIGALLLNNGSGGSALEQLRHRARRRRASRPATGLGDHRRRNRARAVRRLVRTHNTLAAYQNGFSLARQLPGSRVLSRDGDDYSLVVWSPCTAAALAEYAITGRLPAPGTLCLD
jgi:hypothetical protein